VLIKYNMGNLTSFATCGISRCNDYYFTSFTTLLGSMDWYCMERANKC